MAEKSLTESDGSSIDRHAARLTRGQVGPGRLLAFILAIAITLIVVPAAFDVAGIDIRDSTTVVDLSEDDEREMLAVHSSYGAGLDENRTSVGVVEVLVTGTNQTSVDVEDLTVTWEHEQTLELTPTTVDGGDASFQFETSHGSTTLTDTRDKAVLRFDIGDDDLRGVDSFGERLEPGDVVTIKATTGDGEYVETKITIPESFPPGPTVRFG